VGAFDDLVPAAATPASGAFDDLVPAPKRQVGALESYNRGTASLIPHVQEQGRMLVTMPLAVVADKIAQAFGGDGTTFQDRAGRSIDEAHAEVERQAIDPRIEEQGLGGKIAQASPQLLTDLLAAFATGGDSLAAREATTAALDHAAGVGIRRSLEGAAGTAARASVVPGAEHQIDTEANVSRAGGTPDEAAAAGTAAYASTTAANLLPVAAQGNALIRALTGAAVAPVVSRVSNDVDNLALPDRLGLDHNLTPADYLMASLSGAGLAGVLGERPHAPFDLRTPIDPAARAAVADAPLPDVADPALRDPSTPAARAPEATAPPPEPVQPAPPADAGALIAALTGTTPPVSSVAPVRDFTSNVRTSDWTPPASDVPVPVKRVEAHPAPEPELTIDTAADDAKAGDGLATRVVTTTTGKKGKPGAVRELIFRPEHDDLRTWIAVNGGIKPEVAAELGIKDVGKPLRPATRKAKLVSEDGMTTDQVRERMQQDGWLPPEDPSRPSESDPRNLIYDALHRGERIEHPQSTSREREGAARDDEARAHDEALARQQGTTVPDLYDRGARSDARLEGADDVEHPPGHAPVEGRIRVLRAKRAAGLLDEAGAHELIDLMEHDDRTAKLAGGTRLDVGNMKAEGEAPEPSHKAFVDLDNFKGINDRIGHAAGDQVIAQTAALLAHQFPGAAFHRGGDEFIIHGQSPEHLQAGLDAVRDALATAKMELTAADGRSVSLDGVGMSYGVGEHVDAAEAGLHADKQARLDAGLRTERRAADRDGGGDARGASERAENPPAAGAGDVRQAAAEHADEVAVAEPPPAKPSEPAEPPPQQAEIPGLPDDERPTTGTKNEVRDAERAERGLPPVPKEDARGNEEVIAQARKAMEDNPSRASEVIEKLRDQGNTDISVEDEAVLMVEAVRLMNARNRAADRASDPSLSEHERTVAKREFDAAEEALNSLDEATRASGSTWGRFGQFRQRRIREDYSLEALDRKERARLGRPLTIEEHATIKAMADKIAAKDAEIATLRDQLETASAHADVAAVYAQVLKEVGGKPAPGVKPERPTLAKLRERADASRERLRKKRGQFNAGVDPADFIDLVNIGVYHVARGAKTLGEFAARMREDLGEVYESVKASLPDVFKAAKQQHETIGAKKPPATPEEAFKAIDPNKITHRDIYNLARAHVQAGVRGENAVMAAVHADVQKIAPSLTERDVRRLFSDYGKAKFPSKEADKVELRQIRALVQLQESIDRLESGLSALKSGPQRDKATQAVREKRARLNELLKQAAANAAPSPEKLASYQQARATNLRNQIADLEKQLRTGEKPTKAEPPEPNAEVQRLTAIRDDLRAQLDAIEEQANPRKSPEQRFQERTAKSLQKRADEIRERIRVGDYSKHTRPPPKALSEANEKAKFELAKLKAEFAQHQFLEEMKARSPLKKVLGTGIETMNLARAVMTSLDLSAVLRQGGFIVLGHPIRGAKSLVPSLKAFASEQAQFAADEEITSRANFPLYKKAGLELTEHNNHLPSKMEEAFMSRWIDRVPTLAGGGLLRGSQRAYTTFLNKLRADSFDAMAASLGAKEALTHEEAKAIANFINVATGRGKLGKNNQGAVGLNSVFFAPRLVASRFNLLAGQPMYAGSMRTRAQVAVEYARFLTGVAAVIGLGSLAHDPADGKFVELDPRSADFLKMKFGDTYVDPLTGLAQVTTFLAREITGEKMTGGGDITPIRNAGRWTNLFSDYPDYHKVGFGADDSYTIATRFARTKLAPIPGTVVNLMVGSDVVGNPVTPGSAIAGLVTPLSLQNVKEIMTEHGVAEGTAIEMLNLLGMGVQYRKPRERNADAAAKREKARAADPRGIGDLSLQERIDAWKTMGADERRDTNMIKHIRDAARTHRKDMTDQQREDVRAILDSQ
jgi:diguanylate cyclase (GGDEF)-like protein